jgi:LmbE family N-acetylglucosaminyl deacetylase
MAEPLTLMAVHAHPDDESSSTGGVLARYSAEGIRTVVVTCTNGALGDLPGKVKPGEDRHDEDEVVRIRAAELKIAAEALGVSHVEMLGYLDSGMRGWPQNERPEAFHNQPVDVVADRIIELFEQYRPQVVITYYSNAGYNHPDHVHAHDVTVAAVERSGIPEKLYLIARPMRNMERLRELMAQHGIEFPRPPQPQPGEAGDVPPRPPGVDESLITTFIDAGPYVEKKRAALAAHASQLEESFFLKVPDAAWGEIFGTETFIREYDTTGAAIPEHDLFAGLR